jgi:SAM-dependent methyltransferase
MRAALRPGGRLAFVCWRKPAENPWMMVPMEAALKYVPAPPPDDPQAPGPFAFAPAERVRVILHGAGFSAVELEPFDYAIGGFALDQALTLALRVGPLGRLLRESPDQIERVVGAVREALAGYATPDGVRMPSATWIVTARA